MQPIFVGRQPIFDGEERIIGFELLFRAGANASEANVVDGDLATSDLLHSAFIDIGMENLVGEHLAFVNLPRGFLDHEVLQSLPPEQVVLEILEDIVVDDEVIAAVRRLKEHGFRIALDDYQFREQDSPLIELADIVKLDLLAFDGDSLRAEIERLRPFNVELLAEKVEDAATYATCRELGFLYYQGFFLSYPNVVEGQRLEQLEVGLLQLIEKLQDPEMSAEQLAAQINAHPDLAIHVLRQANSPLLRHRRPIETLREAIVLLGTDRVRSLAMVAALRTSTPQRQGLEQVMIRARMAALLAAPSGVPNESERYFTLGLLSGLDRVLGIPLHRVLGELNLSPAMEDALLEQSGELGAVPRIIETFEDPDRRFPFEVSPVSPQVAGRLYMEAVRWTESMLVEMQGASSA